MLNSISNLPSVLFGPQPNPGDSIGNYKLLQKLGAGGMGQVWKAAHQTTGELYAIKLLPQMIATHPDAWDQVLANFQLVRKLNHQNICPVHLLERDPQWGPYLVMTFIDGISLAKYRQRKETFTVEEVAALLKPVADALDYAHAQKIIHRDVKHDNILLTLADDGETITGTFVIDFGLAAQVRSTINRFSQQSVTAAGTRPYMAPEIWGSRPPVAASDQYSLAVIAYELLAGFFPFDGDDVAVLREAVLKETVTKVSSLNPNANRALLKGLSKKPEDRFSSCGKIVESVEREASTPVPEREPPLRSASPPLIDVMESLSSTRSIEEGHEAFRLVTRLAQLLRYREQSVVVSRRRRLTIQTGCVYTLLGVVVITLAYLEDPGISRNLPGIASLVFLAFWLLILFSWNTARGALGTRNIEAEINKATGMIVTGKHHSLTPYRHSPEWASRDFVRVVCSALATPDQLQTEYSYWRMKNVFWLVIGGAIGIPKFASGRHRSGWRHLYLSVAIPGYGTIAMAIVAMIECAIHLVTLTPKRYYEEIVIGDRDWF